MQAMLALTLLTAGGAKAAGAPCTFEQSLALLPTITPLATNTTLISCFAKGSPGTPLANISDITNCSSTCHADVLTFLHSLEMGLVGQDDCTLGIGLLPLPPSELGPLQSVFGGNTNLSSASLRAEETALALPCQGNTAGTVCTPAQVEPVVETLVSASMNLSCYNSTSNTTPLSQLPSVTKCGSCHSQALNLLQSVAAGLRHSGCALAVLSIPQANRSAAVVQLTQSLLAGAPKVNGTTLDAEAYLLQSTCTTDGNNSVAACLRDIDSLKAGPNVVSRHVCARLISGAFFSCYCDYVQQQMLANLTLYTAQELSNLYCSGSVVPDDCYPMTGNCAAGSTVFPQCAGPMHPTNHNPASKKGGDDQSETDAIVISVVVAIVLFMAVFGTLLYARVNRGRRLDAFSSLNYLEEDEADEEMFTPDDIGASGVSSGSAASPTSRLHIAQPVYEDHDGFEPSTGEEHGYA